jgi:hypothetical protein
VKSESAIVNLLIGLIRGQIYVPQPDGTAQKPILNPTGLMYLKVYLFFPVAGGFQWRSLDVKTGSKDPVFNNL